jgi:hypothetical protein
MPFKSDAQRRWMYANHPAMAKRWQEHTPKGKDLPEHVSKKKKRKKKGHKKKAEDARSVILALLQRMQGGESLSDILEGLKTKDPEVVIPGLDVDTPLAGAKMEAEGSDMDKRSEASRLEKLDLKGVGPDMLQAIMNRDAQTVLAQPIMLQRKGERLERIRRLKDELKMPGSHLKPEKKKNPAEAAAEEMMPSSPHMPAGPGSPIAPSNLLGGFAPEQMGQLPKMSSVKRANGDEEEENYEPVTPQQAASIINMIARTKGEIKDEEQFHEHAEEIGANPHAAEEAVYKTLGSLIGGKNDLIPGGLAAGMPTSMFPKDQIEKGTEVELEHSSNPAIAQEIAKDHLTEGDDYYEPRLDDLEKGMEDAVDAGRIEAVGEGTKKHTENKERKDRDVEQLKKAYKYGFFLKCAETGATPSEIEKKAFLGPLLGWIGLKGAQKGGEEAGGVLGTAKDLSMLALIAPAIAAPLLGAAAGGAYRHATAPGYASPEEFRHAERLATLKHFAREAKRRTRKKRQRG